MTLDEALSGHVLASILHTGDVVAVLIERVGMNIDLRPRFVCRNLIPQGNPNAVLEPNLSIQLNHTAPFVKPKRVSFIRCLRGHPPQLLSLMEWESDPKSA